MMSQEAHKIASPDEVEESIVVSLVQDEPDFSMPSKGLLKE
jgi:hypothetical protein